MKKYHTSFRRRKQQKVNDLCAKMRKAKEQKRVAGLGERPEQRAANIHAMTITATDHRTGHTVNIEMYEHTGNIRSYWVREKGKGWWTKTACLNRVAQYIGKAFSSKGTFN